MQQARKPLGVVHPVAKTISGGVAQDFILSNDGVDGDLPCKFAESANDGCNKR